MKYAKITLPYRIKSGVLAFGAQSKAAFCFAKGNAAYLSESSGDLSDLDNFKKFERDIKRLQKKIKIKPGIIACDLHPEYSSTKYAYDLAKGTPYHKGTGQVEHRVKKIQHHEAHVASCIADNSVKGKVIGIAFDGTGFGRDGNIWGGEFFIGDTKGLKRVGHLKYIPMPGGETAIREPWRMAVSYLYAIYGSRQPKPRSFGKASLKLYNLPKGRGKGRVPEVLRQMIDKKINSPLTSSIGRLFDGVSSLIGVCDFAGYEGEAAIKLEKMILAQGSRLKVQGKYEFKYDNKDGVMIIDWGPVIKGIVKDLKQGVKKSGISRKFHSAICDMIKDVCIVLRKKCRINKVCLSGGVFQNKYLIMHVKPMLEKAGFDVYGHKNIPTHDGGIALGQAVLAGRERF